MPEVARQYYQPVMLPRRGDNDVGKSRRLAEASCPIRDRARNPRCHHIESKNAIAIKVQYRLQPR